MNDFLLQSGVEGFTPKKFKAFFGVLTKTLCPGQSMEELLQEAEKKETEEHLSISEVKELINGTEDKNLKALLLSTMVNRFSFQE